MPTVDVTTVMHAPVDAVWRAVADVESYPSFMAGVDSVEVVDDLPDGSRLTAWSVQLKGSLLEWTERDVAVEADRRLEFEQVEGDLEVFRGAWTVTEEAGGAVRVRLQCDFDIGIPLLSDMLDPVAAEALTENSRDMLREIERRVAA